MKLYYFFIKSRNLKLAKTEKKLILNSFEALKSFLLYFPKKRKDLSIFSLFFLKLFFFKLTVYQSFIWGNVSELHSLFFQKTFFQHSFFEKKNDDNFSFNPDFLSFFFNFNNDFSKFKDIKYLFLCFCNLRLQDPLLYFYIKKLTKQFNIKVFYIGGLYDKSWINLGNDHKTLLKIQNGQHWVSNFLDSNNVFFFLGKNISTKRFTYPFVTLNTSVGNRNAQFLGLSSSSFFSKSKKFIGEMFLNFSLKTVKTCEKQDSIKILMSTHQPSLVSGFDFLLPSFSFLEKKGNYLSISSELKEVNNLFGFQFDSMLHSFYNRNFHDHLVYDSEVFDIKRWRLEEKLKMLSSKDLEHFFAFDPLNLFSFGYIYKVNENFLFEKILRNLFSLMNKDLNSSFSFFYSFFLLNLKLFKIKNSTTLNFDNAIFLKIFHKYSSFWSQNMKKNVYALNSLLTHQTFKRHFLPLEKKNY